MYNSLKVACPVDRQSCLPLDAANPHAKLNHKAKVEEAPTTSNFLKKMNFASVERENQITGVCCN
jgi:hypothetical protein